LVKVDSSMTGLNGVLTLTPIKNQFGTGKLTITVDDGYAQSSADLTVTVTHVNQAPTIVITNTSVALVQGEMSAVLTAMVDDVDNSPDQLTVTVTSDKADIISPDGVFLNPADLGSLPRNFVIVPNGDAVGTATLTFTHSKPASAAAVSLAVSSTGAARLTTTPLITPEEMDHTAGKKVAYKAPGV